MSGSRNRLDEPAFPIRTVAELTGIATGTLRAWERRYGLVKPERTASGHRLYSRRDIERLQRAMDLLDGGVALTRIADLLDAGADHVLPAEAADSARLRSKVLKSLSEFDGAALEEHLRRALLTPDTNSLGRRFLLPLSRDLALRWRVDNQVAEQRLLESALRSVLASCRNGMSDYASVIATTLPEERHEAGLLMLAILAGRRGLPLTLLGAGTPLDNLIAACARARAPAILLYGERPDTGSDRGELAGLTAAAGCPVFVAGPIVRLASGRLDAAGARLLDEDPVKALEALAACVGGYRND